MHFGSTHHRKSCRTGTCLCLQPKVTKTTIQSHLMIGSISFLFFEAQEQTLPDKPLAPPNQAQQQRASRAFTSTPVGLNPEPF